MNNINELSDLLKCWSASIEGKNEELAANILDTASELLLSPEKQNIKKEMMHSFLNETGSSLFLSSLNNTDEREKWAQTALHFIRLSSYNLLDMFKDRMRRRPDNILFRDMSFSRETLWSYRIIGLKTREIAAAFYSISKTPIVAVLSENSLDSACCDLACLFYDIPDTPLSPYFNSEVLSEIFEQLGINIVVAGSEELLEKLLKTRRNHHLEFDILTTFQGFDSENESIYFLNGYTMRFGRNEIDSLLDSRKRKSLKEVSTLMFTSGSTGRPKGVSFSMYNLVSKRFARAAALPKVGDEEVLLCFLPLFHTFGRYLEMLGMIYWGGTYVFTGNPSSETLLSLFPKVNPTGLISIPLRWYQLYEKSLAGLENQQGENQRFTLDNIIGKRLRWGLSAAGYLDPKVFRFFQKNGVELCSGFGMTEATGGITMTPPGAYRDFSTGRALPGVNLRQKSTGELQMSGHYIARYLEDKGIGDEIPYPDEEEHWLGSGDVFKKDSKGFYKIVDRVKDIYKNNKGQTIAPRKVESKFIGVPGIKKTFLVGDGMDFNVLLIYPDYDDPVISLSEDDASVSEYFHQIITSANQDLAPFERVINYSLIERDFSIEKGELTPKGSFKRKNIEKNFESLINELYKSNHVVLNFHGLSIKIPHWFFRDESILEDDIVAVKDGLLNRRTKQFLHIQIQEATRSVIIGDLEYHCESSEIDLGLFCRQPMLWAGNPGLIGFGSCKEGWDLPLNNVSRQVYLPWQSNNEYSDENYPTVGGLRDPNLSNINYLICRTLFSGPESAYTALTKIKAILPVANERISELLRRRLEALARHPEERIRCLSYQILLLDEPTLDYSIAFPAFVESGLSFLNKESINEIALYNFGKRRLEALRQRLLTYRKQLSWPASEKTVSQFEEIFKLLVNFVSRHPEFYSSVRAELASWILHREDTKIVEASGKYFTALYETYETLLNFGTRQNTEEEWNRRLVFDYGLSADEIEAVKTVINDRTFLKQSIILAFDEDSFEPESIPAEGIWVSRVNSQRHDLHFRFSINTLEGKHFDLLVILHEDQIREDVLESIYWLTALAGYPFYPRVLPRLGSCRPELKATSMAFVSELSVWEKIREFSGARAHDMPRLRRNAWRKLYVESLSAYFRAWHNSGYEIVPGIITPENVAVPALDFREGAAIMSLSGFSKYENTLSMVEPMLRNFFRKTAAHYPWCRPEIDPVWIFDACYEALGDKGASVFLDDLKRDLEGANLKSPDGRNLLNILKDYNKRRMTRFYKPLPLLNAIERYGQWLKMNPDATPKAREETVIELYRLYRIYLYPEIGRYYLYRNTYFAGADGELSETFDLLLRRMERDRQATALQMVELSDLQSVLTGRADKDVFARMVFPRKQGETRHSIIKIVEDSSEEKVIIHSYIKDRKGEQYTFRAAVNPAEIGQLYRLFYLEKFQKSISERDLFYIVIDSHERIVGGLCYTLEESRAARIDGTVISTQLKGRGIGTAMVDAFCNHMAGKGIDLIKTHFFLRNFFLKLGFKVDKSWGALVKFLTPKDEQDKESFRGFN